MAIKPILFNTEMVRAILDGRKSCTRRLVKTRRKDACGFYVTRRKTDGSFTGIYEYDENESMFDNPLEPPYQPGDILYVRESVFQGVGRYLDVSGETVCVLTNYFEYYADGLHEKDHWKDKYENTWMHRRPSIHMPKEAARIWLKVTDVRVERLQDMTDDDAEAEGCFDYTSTALGFPDVWDSTIKKSDLDRYGWDANPWVWVIEFERCKKPEEDKRCD